MSSESKVPCIPKEGIMPFEDWLAGRRARRESGNLVAPEVIGEAPASDCKAPVAAEAPMAPKAAGARETPGGPESIRGNLPDICFTMFGVWLRFPPLAVSLLIKTMSNGEIVHNRAE